LQSSAKPGQVYVLKTTFDLIDDSFIGEVMEPLFVKGRAQPVEVYLLKDVK